MAFFFCNDRSKSLVRSLPVIHVIDELESQVPSGF